METMARIVYGSYVVRFPLGGAMWDELQWLVGLQQLGHDVYFVEKSGWPDSCFDPSTNVESADCSYGISALRALLGRFGLQDRWCFVDAATRYHGLSQEQVEAIFKSADLFVDMGPLYEWCDEAAATGLRVVVDGKPGFTQMQMEMGRTAGRERPQYDAYYTLGHNIGTDRSTAPTAGRQWRAVFWPVTVGLLSCHPAKADAPFTTVMQWRSHDSITFKGITYGQKDIEFAKFMRLPALTTVPLEIGVSAGSGVRQQLMNSGWRVREANAGVAQSSDSYLEYIRASRGEFSVCKNVFVATNSGWFGGRAGAYLASGRPVVMQDSGFSAHLPCGRGLFAVRTVEEAAGALNEIHGDYERHSKWAREIALEHLDSRRVLGRFLRELGV